MKIVFMGTPEFAVPSLKKLIEEYDVTAVFTQPDRPSGRGKKLAMPAVKEEALKHNIPVYQPERIKNDNEIIEMLKGMEPDFIIVVAFGQILPKAILDIPKYGCINLHGSLLPKYRGAAPIQWAVVKGEKKSGNTTMLMDVGLDTGDMLLTDEVEIGSNMTGGELHDILMERGADLLVTTIKEMVNGNITPVKQNDSESCYASMLNKEIAKVDWKNSANDIHNLIRGLNPWPVAHSKYKDAVMKIYESEVLNQDSKNEPGFIVEASKEGIVVATGDKNLLIKRVQFPGGKPLRVEEYIKGNTIDKGIILT